MNKKLGITFDYASQLQEKYPFFEKSNDVTWLSENESLEASEKEGRPNSARIKSASLVSLIELITQPQYDERDIIYFLWSYHAFPSYLHPDQKLCSEELLALFIIRYEGPMQPTEQFNKLKDTIHSGVMNVLRLWVEYVPEDFENKSFKDTFVWWIKANDQKQYNLIQSMFVPVQKLTLPPRKTQVQNEPDFSVKDLTKELCLIEYKFLSSFSFNEFIHKAWEKDKTKSLSINQYLDWFHHLSWWASGFIISGKTSEIRAFQITKLIQTAKKLKKLNNFGSLFAIIFALNSDSVSRLKQSWELVKEKYKVQFDKLNQFVDPKRNFKLVRQAVSTCLKNGDTAIPFVGILLSDFTFFDDGNQDLMEDDLINFEKYRMMSREFWNLKSLLKKPYHFTSDPEYEKYLLTVVTLNEEDLYRASKLTESGELPALPNKFIRFMSNFSEPQMSQIVPPKILTERDWQILLTCATEITYYQGDKILDQNNYNICLFRVKTGSVTVFKMVNKQSQVIRTLKEGKTFGEISFFSAEGKTSASVIAEEKTTLYKMEKTHLETLFETSSRLAKRFYFTFGKILSKKVEKLNLLGELSRSSSNNDYEKIILNQDQIEKANKVFVKLSKKLDELRFSEENTFIADELSKHLVLCSKTEDLIFSERDKRIIQLFKLEGSQIVIKTFPCCIKNSNLKHFGLLYLTQSYLCFFSQLFGIKQRKKISISEIVTIHKEEKLFIVITSSEKIVFQFKKDQVSQLEGYLKGIQAFLLLKQESSTISEFQIGEATERPPTKIPSKLPHMNTQTLIQFESGILTEEDWNLLIGGSKVKIFKKGDVIISAGKASSLYQIVDGTVSIKKEIHGQSTILTRLHAPQTFGEVSFFLQEKTSNYDIVVESEEVSVYLIELYFIYLMFERVEGFASRWLKYLCAILARRLFSFENIIISTL